LSYLYFTEPKRLLNNEKLFTCNLGEVKEMNKIQKNNQKIDCFVIMPISVPEEMIKNKIYEDKNHFKLVYEHIIKPAILENEWKPIFPETKGSDIIISDIIDHLLNSEMVVCDISILNPNVFYEAGIRTALNKPIAYIKDDTTVTIPFDTSGINHETYRNSLKVNYVKEDINKLKDHFKNTNEKSGNENLVWKKFGLKIKAEQPLTTENPIDAKLDIMMERIKGFESTIRSSDRKSELLREVGHKEKMFKELTEACTQLSDISIEDEFLEVAFINFEKVPIKTLRTLRKIGNKYGYILDIR